MLKRLKGLKHVTPGEWQAGPPRRSDGCGLGVAFACAVGRSAKLLRSFKGFKRLKRFKGFRGFKGLRAGKRQAWTPIRSHGCGLGVPVGCAGKRSEKLLQSFKSCKGFRGFKRFTGFKGFKGLRAGKRQAWMPIRSH